jgi:hypothetical protein
MPASRPEPASRIRTWVPRNRPFGLSAVRRLVVPHYDDDRRLRELSHNVHHSGIKINISQTQTALR